MRIRATTLVEQMTDDEAELGDAVPSDVDDELCSPRKTTCVLVLVLLDEAPGHGYDLMARFASLEVGELSPARVYRALRWLESAGLLEQDWEVSPSGPARRIYRVGPEGRRALRACAPRLRAAAGSLEPPIARFLLERLPGRT